MLIVITGQGKNVFDLISSIEKRVKDKNLLITLGRIVSETLGNKINEANDIFFDYATAKDSVEFFDVNDIPKLSPKSIPPEITNVHFDCNLSKLNAANLKKYKSKLYKVL